MGDHVLENKLPEDITSDDLDALIGREENQRLEFKENYGRDDNKEIAKDICSFANADGGYIVIGARVAMENKLKCIGFSSVVDPEILRQRIIQVVLDCVSERIAGLQTRVYQTSSGEQVVLIYIPPSLQKPHMVTKDKRTDFWKRYLEDTRLMTIAEIRDAAINGSDIFLLQNIIKQNDYIAKQFQFRQSADLIAEVSQDRGRVAGITNVDTLLRSMDHLFEYAVQNDRYFRLTITPHNLRGGLFNPSDAKIQEILSNPPQQRAHGWNMKSIAPIRIYAAGLESETLNNRYLYYLNLLTSGHLEFWTPIDDHFCWNQDPQEMERHPRLYPYAATEHPISFLRLAKALYQQLNLSCPYNWRMQYWNLQGCILLPYHPGIVDFDYPFNHPIPYKDLHFMRDANLDADFDPDASALILIEKLYQAFTYSRSHIPFFDKNGQFLVK